MKFALVNGNKTEPQPGLQGTCINCQSDTLAKCGQVKIWHWAHKSKITCDTWWENETEWHRAWKNHFSDEWQENIHIDPITGEKHIADIKTANGVVIEFQHSAIHPTEIQSREAFYKSMLWVVDGTRLTRDYPRFLKGINELRRTVEGFLLCSFPDEHFPKSWLTSKVPVYFDFQGSQPIDEQDKLRSSLWCLFPGRIGRYAVIAAVSRKQFIELASANTHLLFGLEKLNKVSEYIQLQQKLATTQMSRPFLNTGFRGRRFRRF